MANHASPSRASAVRVEIDHLRSAGAALADECRQGRGGAGALDVAERLPGGQGKGSSVDGNPVNAGLVVQNEIGVFLARVAEQESVSTAATKDLIVAGPTIDDVGCAGALDAVSEVVAVDDHC